MSKQKAATISRRIPNDMKTPLRQYATAVGELVWASNAAHTEFAILFCHVATPKNFMVGRAVWLSSKSDAGQIEMLEAAAKASETSERLSRKMLANILWATGKAKQLGQKRNDAVHSPTGFLTKQKPVKIVPLEMGIVRGRFSRLQSTTDLKREFRLVKSDLVQLNVYVRHLWTAIEFPGVYGSLPRRPRLRSCPMKEKQRGLTP